MNLLKSLGTIVGVATSATDDPSPTPWPQSFSATYMSNLTDLSLGGNGSAPVLDPGTAVSAQVSYDYRFKAQRVDHAAGADECVRFYHTDLPCTTLMNSQGMYRMLQGKVDTPCCLDLPGVECPPPAWASMAVEGRDYLGDDMEAVSGQMCHHWRWPMRGNYSHYYEVVATGRPARWTFPASEGKEDWYFAQASFEVGPHAADLFVIPATCASKNCSSSGAAHAV